MEKNKKTMIEKLNSPFAKALRDLLDGIDSPLGRKISQKELADAVGVSRQVISQYCNGDTSPNVEKLYNIAKFFNVSSDFLIGLTSTPTTNAEDRMIHEKTGLSDRSIQKLKRWKKTINTNYLITKNDKVPIDDRESYIGHELEMEKHATIDFLLSIESESGEDLLSLISNYIYSDYVYKNPKTMKCSNEVKIYNKKLYYDRTIPVQWVKDGILAKISASLIQCEKEIKGKEKS